MPPKLSMNSSNPFYTIQNSLAGLQSLLTFLLLRNSLISCSISFPFMTCVPFILFLSFLFEPFHISMHSILRSFSVIFAYQYPVFLQDSVYLHHQIFLIETKEINATFFFPQHFASFSQLFLFFPCLRFNLYFSLHI